jgi:hypothetical protein
MKSLFAGRLSITDKKKIRQYAFTSHLEDTQKIGPFVVQMLYNKEAGIRRSTHDTERADTLTVNRQAKAEDLEENPNYR